MRPLAPLLLAAVVASACAANAAAPAPSGSAERDQSATILASDGGVMRPIDNGGRLALRSGYATVRLWPSPKSMDPDVYVAVFDSAGAARTADVSIDWEMLDMDHGFNTEHAKVRDGASVTRLSFGMAGRWRLTVHITRDGVEEKVILLLPSVGL